MRGESALLLTLSIPRGKEGWKGYKKKTDEVVLIHLIQVKTSLAMPAILLRSANTHVCKWLLFLGSLSRRLLVHKWMVICIERVPGQVKTEIIRGRLIVARTKKKVFWYRWVSQASGFREQKRSQPHLQQLRRSMRISSSSAPGPKMNCTNGTNSAGLRWETTSYTFTDGGG